MSNCGCHFKCSCIAAALVVSVIAGIIGAFLQITAAITLTPVVYQAFLGIAVAYLGVLALAAGNGQFCVCSCAAMNTVLLGILGTILFSGILLAAAFPATSILGAVFVGLLFASFTLILTATVCLIRSVSGCNR